MEDTSQNTAAAAAALVAVCQMNSTNDVERNLGICKDLVKKAKSRGAKVRFSTKYWLDIITCFPSTARFSSERGAGGKVVRGRSIFRR